MGKVQSWVVLSTVAAVLAIASPTLSASPATCSQADAERADETSSVATWPKMYAMFKRYAPRCDDGGIAEGWDDSITRLLAYHWEDFGQLVRLTRKDAAFESFVLRHLGTGALDDMWKAEENIRTACPREGRALCAKLKKTLGGFLPHSR